jgi:hypothetical protein
MEAQRVLTGIFASRREAERVRSRILESGLPRDRIEVVQRIRADDRSPGMVEADGVLKDVLIESAAGTLIGTALGAAGEVALAAANVTLFTTSPFVAPLAMLGWGAAVGGLIGAAMGAGGAGKRGRLSDILLYAIRSGHVTLVAHTRSDDEDRLVSAAMGASRVEQTARRMGDALH